MQTRSFTYNELKPAFAPENAVKSVARLPIGPAVLAGTVLGGTGVVARNDVKTLTITGTPTGGTWQFTFLGYTSGSIAYNATAAQAQTVVDAFFGAGNCTVTGGPLPGTALVFTFGGVMSNVLIKSFGTNNALTGGTTPAVSFANTTPGSSGAGQVDVYDNSTITVASCVLAIDYTADVNGGYLTERGPTGQPYSPPVFYQGYFKVADLIGLDAAAVTDLGHMAIGTAYNSVGGVLRIT